MRRSRLSSTSSILMMVLGILTFVAVSPLAGAVLTVLGLAMFLVYRRLVRGSGGASRPAANEAVS